MPISFKQAGSLFVSGPNITIFSSGNTYAISGSPVSGGIGYGVTGVTSAGTGQYLFLSGTIVNNNLIQKAISAGTGIAISEDVFSTTLTFRTTGSSIGSAVTGLTSAGTGNRLIFSSLTNNNNLVQKSLSAGTGISIVDSGTGTLTFSSTTTGTIISGTSVGSSLSVPIFSSVTGSNLVFRRILSGSNIGVYLSGNDIVISGTSGAINGVTGITNLGGGSNVLSSVTSGVLLARTISGSNGIEVVESGSNILVRPVTTTTANRLFFSGPSGVLTVDDKFQIDATTGTMTLGFTVPNSNVTSRLLIAGGSASISQLRLTAYAAAYSGATAGDIWYNSTSGNSLFFNKSTSAATPFIFKDNNYIFTSAATPSLSASSSNRLLEVDTTGTLFATKFLNALGVFTTITSKTISNTILETSVLSTGATFLYGDNLLNSSSHGTNPNLLFGKKYRFNARGIISGTSGGTFYGKMFLGSSLIASSSTFNLNQSLNNNYFEIDTTFTILDVGSTGRVIGSGKMLTDATSLISGVTRPIVAVSSLGGLTGITLNTLSDQFFDFTINFSTASTTNAVIISEATLEYLN